MARNAFNGPFHTGNGRPGPFSGTHLCLSDSIIPLHRHFSASGGAAMRLHSPAGL